MIAKLRSLIARLFAFCCRMVLILTAGVAAYGLAVIGWRFRGAAMLLLAVFFWRRFRRWQGSYAYGSARTASLAEMEAGGLFAEDGLILGRYVAERPSLRQGITTLLSPTLSSEAACRTFLASLYGKGWMGKRLLRVKTYVHLLTCSPAGGGKGIGVVTPNLLSYRGSCVVVDPKGESFRISSEHRKKKFKHTIIRLDPFNLCGPGGDTLNPLDFIDHTADDFLDQIRDLANQIIIRPHDPKDPHWDDSAELTLTALTAFVCGAEPDRSKRTLQTVRRLASDRQKYAKAVEVMQQVDTCQGVIQQLGGQLTWHAGDEQSSILSTFTRHTAFLDSPAVARNTSSSSFDPMILRKGKAATIYLILPHDRLVSLSRLQRLWIGTIMRRITQGTPTEANPVLWLLDEMAHIGPMQAIEDAVTLMRGMGIRLWFIFQSIGQIKSCFGDKAEAVLDNIGTQQYFGITSYETAEILSKKIGDATVSIVTDGDSTSNSHPTGTSAQPQGGNRSRTWNTNRSEISRRLVKENEVLNADPDVIFLFHKHLPVCFARLVKFYNAPEFRWGGTAKPRRIGLAAGVLAAFTLIATTFITALALEFARPLEPYQTGGMGNPWQNGPFYYQPYVSPGEGGFLFESE